MLDLSINEITLPHKMLFKNLLNLHRNLKIFQIFHTFSNRLYRLYKLPQLKPLEYFFISFSVSGWGFFFLRVYPEFIYLEFKERPFSNCICLNCMHRNISSKKVLYVHTERGISLLPLSSLSLSLYLECLLATVRFDARTNCHSNGRVTFSYRHRHRQIYAAYT